MIGLNHNFYLYLPDIESVGVGTRGCINRRIETEEVKWNMCKVRKEFVNKMKQLTCPLHLLLPMTFAISPKAGSDRLNRTLPLPLCLWRRDRQR